MRFPTSFKVSTPSDNEIRVTRDFDASPATVFDACTRPELVRRWRSDADGAQWAWAARSAGSLRTSASS